MTPTRPRVPGWIWLGVAVVTAGGGWVRADHLGTECFDQDELYAVRVRGVSPAAVGAVVARDGLKTNHPPLMTVPYLPWVAAVGTDEAAVRGLPWLAATLTLPAVFWLGRQLGGPRAGLFAAAALAVNPLHVTYAQEARQYALLGLLVTLSHALAVRAVTRGRRADAAAYLGVSAAALLTHYFAAPALLGHLAVGGWLAVNRSAAVRAAGVRLVGALGLAGLGLVAWLPVTKYQTTVKWGHLADPTLAALLDALAFAAGVRVPADPWWFAALAGAAALFAFGVVAGRRPLLPAAGDPRPPLPRWVGFVAVGGGLVGVAAAVTVVPRVVFPVARKALEGYQYDAATIDTELGVIGRTVTASAVAAVVFGLVLLTWERLVAWLTARLGAVAWTDRLPSGGGFVAATVLTTVAVVAALGAVDIPFLSARNMIVLAPVVAVGFGLAADALGRSWAGRAVLLVAAAGLVAAALCYDAVAVPVGLPARGQRLGMDTPDWKAAAGWLRARPGGPLPVYAVRHPVTDPFLYYAAAFDPKRLKPDDPLDRLPSRFLLVHWIGRADSEELVDRLRAAGFTVAEEQRGAELVLLRVEKP